MGAFEAAVYAHDTQVAIGIIALWWWGFQFAVAKSQLRERKAWGKVGRALHGACVAAIGLASGAWVAPAILDALHSKIAPPKAEATAEEDFEAKRVVRFTAIVSERSVDRLLAEIRRDPRPAVVVFESRGGDLGAAARFIRRSKDIQESFAAMVPAGGQCVSGCADMFAGARHRFVQAGGTLWIHNGYGMAGWDFLAPRARMHIQKAIFGAASERFSKEVEEAHPGFWETKDDVMAVFGRNGAIRTGMAPKSHHLRVKPEAEEVEISDSEEGPPKWVEAPKPKKEDSDGDAKVEIKAGPRLAGEFAWTRSVRIEGPLGTAAAERVEMEAKAADAEGGRLLAVVDSPGGDARVIGRILETGAKGRVALMVGDGDACAGACAALLAAFPKGFAAPTAVVAFTLDECKGEAEFRGCAKAEEESLATVAPGLADALSKAGYWSERNYGPRPAFGAWQLTMLGGVCDAKDLKDGRGNIPEAAKAAGGR